MIAKGLPEDVSIILYENEITGRELLALTRDNLKTMGMKRVGNVALLSKEIEKLEKASRDIVTLIEHSPYCFGKMLDYLCSKQLHSQGLLRKNLRYRKSVIRRRRGSRKLSNTTSRVMLQSSSWVDVALELYVNRI